VHPSTPFGPTPPGGASALSRAMRRGMEPLLAPAAAALAVGLQVLALGHAWRRLRLPAIGPLEAPPVNSAQTRSSRASGPAGGNGQSGPNVTFAHELRRRLAALRVLSEAIEMRNGSEDDIDRLVHLLVRELHDLEELEDAMLGPGKRQARDEVDVLEVARSAAQTVGLARHSQVTVQGSRRPLRLRTNPTMLRQALENLMDNAATCGAGRPVEVFVRLSVSRRQAGIEVLVADQGPGFGKAAASRRPGQGVGLPLVRKFAQDSGGRLWCRDRDGGGAVFGLWLPVQLPDFPVLGSGHANGSSNHRSNGNGSNGHRSNGHRSNGNGSSRT
jgi:signal transduction histidine kinase